MGFPEVMLGKCCLDSVQYLCCSDWNVPVQTRGLLTLQMSWVPDERLWEPSGPWTVLLGGWALPRASAGGGEREDACKAGQINPMSGKWVSSGTNTFPSVSVLLSGFALPPWCRPQSCAPAWLMYLNLGHLRVLDRVRPNPLLRHFHRKSNRSGFQYVCLLAWNAKPACP